MRKLGALPAKMSHRAQACRLNSSRILSHMKPRCVVFHESNFDDRRLMDFFTLHTQIVAQPPLLSSEALSVEEAQRRCCRSCVLRVLGKYSSSGHVQRHTDILLLGSYVHFYPSE